MFRSWSIDDVSRRDRLIMTDSVTRKHYLVLDSFWGICACLVAVSHFGANSIVAGSSLLDRGGIYVDFFFVLSGFVIFSNYRDRLRDGYSLSRFMFLRFARLYPV